MRPTGDHTA